MENTELISLEINGKTVEVPKGTSILNAAKAAHIKIPTLCYHPDLRAGASCGICVVRQLVPSRNPADNGKLVPSPKLLRACCTEATAGMHIVTHDPDIVQVRKTVLELILANHPNDCLQCPRSGRCELQSLAADFGIRENPFPKEVLHHEPDTSTPSIVLYPDKCIKCGRCAEVCQEMQNVWALEFIQCSAHCPVGAIYENDETAKVWAALQDPEKTCLVQIAPAVRVAVGEAFGMKPGELTTGKIYAALRMIGFDKVFDTNFSADVTIMEEGTEFIKRFTEGKDLPLLTSCCPAWTDWMQQMLSALCKSYWAEKNGVDPKKIHVTSIMPCTAKKYEISRDENMSATGQQDTDVVLTTRELARMIKAAGPRGEGRRPARRLHGRGHDLRRDGRRDGGGPPHGLLPDHRRGAAPEHRLPGGAWHGRRQDRDDRHQGHEGEHRRRAPDGQRREENIAVAHQMGNVEKIINEIREDRKNGVKPRYDFIEVMACRGGCIGGGGQPCLATDEVRAQRTAGIYTDDEKCTLRMSHLNPEVTALYKDYLDGKTGAQGGEKAHHLLHTKYHKRDVYHFEA